jgi:NADP-dependent 3-hydroxy acid dehydrogenase YdfG
MSVFITGASSGIGEACARAFAAARYDLVLVARRLDRLTRLADELKEKHGVTIHTFPLDITDSKQVSQLVRDQAEVFKKVEVLINNAGLAKGRDPIQDGKPEDWDVVINTNLKGLLYVTHAILPTLLANGKGHIINMGSVAGHWVYPNGNVYCATKYGVRALTEGLRMDLHGTGIRVTEISPGMVATEFSEVRFGNKEMGDAVYAGKTPLTAADIAETALWCAQRPARVNIQEVVIFPTEQPGVQMTPPAVTLRKKS